MNPNDAEKIRVIEQRVSYSTSQRWQSVQGGLECSEMLSAAALEVMDRGAVFCCAC